MIELDLQIACESCPIPDKKDFQCWAENVLKKHTNTELTIRIVDTEESQVLNREYRQKDKPTNVLSFPAEIPEFIESNLLGDLVICAPVVIQEALHQRKTEKAHWAHIVTHGILHLLGYDHIDDADAEKMEALEIEALQTLNIANPYQ